MNSRERVKAALLFKEPDRIPRDLWVVPYIQLFRKKELQSIISQYPLDIGLCELSCNWTKIVDSEGREICSCGGKGCFEAMVSTIRILRMAKEKYKEYPDSIIFNNNSPDSVDIYDVFDASNKGDRLALDLMDDVISWFGIGISNIILMYDPQVIIIQGIFTKAGKYFLENLRKKINKISLFSIKRETEIKYSELGDKVGVLGAVSYVLSKYFE